jgi:hypothetical protein
MSEHYPFQDLPMDEQIDRGLKAGLAYVNGRFMTPDQASQALTAKPGRWYSTAMPITAPRIAPPLRLALASLLAECDGAGVPLMVEDPDSPIDPITGKHRLWPKFTAGAEAFFTVAAQGVQVVLDSVLNSRSGKVDEITAHMYTRLAPIAVEHMGEEYETDAAVACVLAFVRGALAVLPLI